MKLTKKRESVNGLNNESSAGEIEQNKDMKHILELRETVGNRIKSIMQGKSQLKNEEKRISAELSPEVKRNQNKQSIGSEKESR